MSYTTAQTSGFRNNCGFHCFALGLFNLDNKTLNNLINSPEHKEKFELLRKNFTKYYGLDDSVTWNQLINLTKSLPNPLDIELMWGPVLRNYCRDKLDEGLKEHLDDDNFVGVDVLYGLSEDLGAELKAYKINAMGKSIEHDYLKHKSGSDNLWTLEMFNVNGNHWESDFGTEGENVKHNSAHKNTQSSLLYNASNLVGVSAQDQEIRRIVQAQLNTLKAKGKLMQKKGNLTFSDADNLQLLLPPLQDLASTLDGISSEQQKLTDGQAKRIIPQIEECDAQLRKERKNGFNFSDAIKKGFKGIGIEQTNAIGQALLIMGTILVKLANDLLPSTKNNPIKEIGQKFIDISGALLKNKAEKQKPKS